MTNEKGSKSILRSYKKYKKEFLELDLLSRTKAKKAQVTQELSYSIVGEPLADVPPNVITRATMHVILGLMKKILDWMFKLFAKLEALEEEATVGSTTYQFCQAIVEARDSAIEYAAFLKAEFKSAIDTIEGKREETLKLMTEIGKATRHVNTAKFGAQQGAWVKRLEILKSECESNRTTEEEAPFYTNFIYQVVMAERTLEHCKELLKEHKCDSEREITKALKDHNVDINAYHGGSIVGNHCMHFASKGDQILDATYKAMLPKISDASNKSYLQNTCKAIKQILKLWYEIMRVMKRVTVASNEDCVAFDKNVTLLNKHIYLLVTNPPVPGCVLKLSKQLKFHLLFDGEVSEQLWTWRTLGGADEQNIEGVHPQFNQLIRRFGNTRGRRRQKLVMEAFLYSHSNWVRETIDEILESTKRKKVSSNNKPRKKRKRDKPRADRGNGGVDCERGEPSQQPGRGDAEGVANEEGVEQAKDGGSSAPGRRSDDEAEGEGGASAAAEMDAIETSINGCSSLHGHQKVDTKIVACPTCKIKILAFAMPIHCHEVHSVHHVEEEEEGQEG